MRRWAHALTTERTPLAALRDLDVPVLCMVARLLVGALPRVEQLEFDELGHMGPISHPQLVNDAIAGFLDRL